MPLTAITRDARREIVAEALMNGDNQVTALSKAGYSKTTALTKSTEVLRRMDIDSYLQDWKERHARGQLEQLTKANISGNAIAECKRMIDSMQDGKDKARLLLELAKQTTSRSQDLLDRAGISKISKSMRITAKVNTRDSEAVSKRIAEIEAKLSNQKAQPGIKKTIKGQYRTVQKGNIQGADTVQDSQTASICQSVPRQTTKNDSDTEHGSQPTDSAQGQGASLDGITEHIGEGYEI